MSIETEITRISTNVSETLSAVSEMGGEVPEGATSDDMASGVRSIPVRAKIDDTKPSSTTTYSSQKIEDVVSELKDDKLDKTATAADSNKLSGKTWAERLLDIYPIGSIYMSVSSISPASMFGGTWEQIEGRFLLAAGSTYTAGSTGGEAEHTLTVDEMPKHAHNGGYREYNVVAGGSISLLRPVVYSYDASGKATLEAGNSKAHNNMPPYLAVYMWKRVS